MNAYSPTMTGAMGDLFVVENVEDVDDEARNIVQGKILKISREN